VSSSLFEPVMNRARTAPAVLQLPFV